MTEPIKTARVRDIEMAFVDSENGPAVLLLHGYPFDKSMWRDQIDFLARNGFRAIAPDLRGLGATSDKLQFVEPSRQRQAEACRTIKTMEDMARDAAGLLDRLEISAAVVCGLSMGGYVAFEFLKLFPSRVRAVVLAGTRAPADNEQERKGRFEQAQRMLAEGMGPIAEATLPKLLAARTLKEKPEVVGRVREMILETDPSGAAAAQRGMAARRDYSAGLAEIDLPALIIVGREDPIRPVADAEFMHRGIHNSQMEIIDDAAHMTNMEQAEAFNETLLRFVKLIH
jgi:pimeloyl-ACP methyl ester carboxylesterase